MEKEIDGIKLSKTYYWDEIVGVLLECVMDIPGKDPEPSAH